MRVRRCPLYVACAGALLLAASPAAAAPRTFTIGIDKLKFGPTPAELHKGDAIIWENHDILRHSATAANRSFDVDLPPGAKVKMVVRATGAVPFTCKYHPGMRGVLTVR